MTLITAGQLNQQVTFRRPVAGEDALGQPVTSFVDHATDVWARVLPARPREKAAADARRFIAPIEVAVRYREDITPDMQVVWHGIAHAIVGGPSDAQGRREFTEMLCATGVQGA